MHQVTGPNTTTVHLKVPNREFSQTGNVDIHVNVDIDSHPVWHKKSKKRQISFTCPRKFLKNDRKRIFLVNC